MKIKKEHLREEHWQELFKAIGLNIEKEMDEFSFTINETAEFNVKIIPNMEAYRLYLSENDDDPDMATLEGLMEVCGYEIYTHAEYCNFDEIFEDERYELKLYFDGVPVTLEDILASESQESA